MIVKENGLKYAKLIHVSVDNGKTDNSNKVYIMEEMSDGRIKCEYGRVGRNLTTEYKPSSSWNSVYKQKTGKSKGYTDVTELIAEPVVDADPSKPRDNKVEAIKDSIVRKLVEDLMNYANKSIQRNYKVTQEAVSEQQIEAAQNVLSSITGLLKIGVDIKEINDLLLKLYTIIPRRMDNVKYHLIQAVKDDSTLQDAQKLLDNEQSALDTMAGQVKLIKQQQEAAKKAAEGEEVEEISDYTILDQMGLSIEVETDNVMIKRIHALTAENSKRIRKIFKVVNNKTQKINDDYVKTADNKQMELFWHGSRNENWFNILQTGLLIRPSGAVYSGSMFGDGIYFANKAQKSIGYSSLRGSYWANGNSPVGYLALFGVHVGNQKHIHKHDSSCYSLNYSGIRRDGYDSVYAHGGADLRNDEFIVYNPAQCSVNYLIEME